MNVGNEGDVAKDAAKGLSERQRTIVNMTALDADIVGKGHFGNNRSAAINGNFMASNCPSTVSIDIQPFSACVPPQS